MLARPTLAAWPAELTASTCNWSSGEDSHPLRLHSPWLKNITDDLTSVDMALLQATDAAQNRSSWRLLALYNAMHS